MFFTNPESTNLQFFFTKFYVLFLRVSFSVMINSYIGIFDRNRKLLPCRKTKQRNFREKICSFVISELVKTCDELDLCLESAVDVS